MFGQEPPVYAKPKQQASMTSSPIASSSRTSLDLRERQPPPPPQPQNGPSVASDKPPARPAKPGFSPSQSSSSSQYGWTNGHTFPARHAEARQTSWHVMEDQARNYDRPHRSASMQSGSSGQSGNDYAAFNRSTSIASQSTPAIPPLPPSHTQYRGAILSPPVSSTLPAPARPPNPELLRLHNALHTKIQARLQHLRNTTSESQHQLRLLINDLDRGEPAIRDEMARLEAVRDVCKATGDGLAGSVTEAQKRIADLNSRSEPDVDNMICATSLVGNQ